MASKQSTIDFILEQIAESGTVLAKKMFGEYAIYYDGNIIAWVSDDKLFVKPTKAGRTFLHELRMLPRTLLFIKNIPIVST